MNIGELCVYNLMVYYLHECRKNYFSRVNDLPPLETPEKSEEVSSSGRVDINILLNRARKEKEKETRQT